ncbi:MAG: glycosyltransferase family 4 protein [Elusimicrobiota bacterium]
MKVVGRRIALAWFDLADPTDRAVARNLARELRALGHRVCLVGPKRRAGQPFRRRVAGVAAYSVGPSPALADAQLAEIHRREAIDVWHCHVFARDHGPWLRAARRGRWPVVVTLHLVLKDYLPFLGGLQGLRRLLAQARRVTLVSKAARGEFLGLCPGWRRRCSVVYNGVAPARGAARPKDKPYVLSIARLAPYKGQDLLLMAFAKVLEQRPDLRLVLCGRDQLKGAVQKLAKTLGLERRVTFTGGVTPRRVRGLLSGCQSFVLPSRRENLPLAVLEAMAAGKAVVATRTGGVPEMVRHGKDGLLVAPGDVDGLARRLLQLSGDSALRRRLGRQAERRSRNFSWRAAATAYVRHYKKVI